MIQYFKHTQTSILTKGKTMSHIYLIANIKIKPEFTEEVISYFKKNMLDQSRAEAGNIKYDMHQGTDDKNLVVMYEIWASEQALKEHTMLDHYKKFGEYSADKVEGVVLTKLNKL